MSIWADLATDLVGVALGGAVAAAAGIVSTIWLRDRSDTAKKKSLSTALAHEVEIVVTLIQGPFRQNYLTDFRKLTEYAPIYHANLDKIDLLPDDLVKAVVTFYTGVRLVDDLPTPQQLTGDEHVVLTDKAKEIMHDATEKQIELGTLLYHDLKRYILNPKSFSGVTLSKIEKVAASSKLSDANGVK